MQRSTSNLLSSIGIVSGLTLLTNLLALVREVLFARAFGATGMADSYVTAASIVATCFLIFAAGSLQGAFMPRYQRALADGEGGRARGLWRSTLWSLLGLLGLICAALMFWPGLWVGWVVPGFAAAQQAQTAELLVWMAPMTLLVGLGSLLQSVAHAHQRFLLPAAVPALNNVLLIAALILVVPAAGVTGFAQATLIGAAAWLVLWPLVQRLLAPVAAAPRPGDLVGLARAMLPLVLLLLADQLSALVQKALVSDLEPGSIAVLNYAARLEGLPVGIFAAAISAVFFPALVAALAGGDADRIGQRFRAGIGAVLFFAVPAAVFLVFEASLTVRVLLERGAFDSAASARAADALVWYAVGLVPQSLIVYLHRAYYATGNTRTPMAVGIFSAVLHILLCWQLVGAFGYLGIAMGTTAYAILYLVLLGVFLPRPMAGHLLGCWGGLWRAATAGVAMAALFLVWPFPPTLLGLGLALGAGGLVYLAVAWLVRDPDPWLGLRGGMAS
jgi:putative peptidoglycan lipid II flippase